MKEARCTLERSSMKSCLRLLYSVLLVIWIFQNCAVLTNGYYKITWARLWNFCSSTGYNKIWISWVLVLFLYESLLFCTCSEACRTITTSVCHWAKVSPFQLVCFACFLGNFYSASHLGGWLQYLLSFYLHSRSPHSGFSACLINTLSV